VRIALLAPVWFPVPPTGYGGIEKVVGVLADGLVAAGHDVTLVASGDSRTDAELVSVFAQAPSERIGQSLPELTHALACLERADDFDVINDHSGLPAAALGGLVATPVVHTVHGPLDGEGGAIYRQIARVAPTVGYISLSLNQRRPAPELPWVANCPNALDLDDYPFMPERGDRLAFVGRMGYDKGAHRAIAVAREAGLPLVIAGKCREPLERAYFDAEIRPHLGRGVEYLGEVSHAEKVMLLASAVATLFPIDWEEPFGLVMIESMAVGTPVIATRRGAVPEVVEDGRTGIVVDRHEDMAAAIEAAARLDPQDCRRHVEARFSAPRMIADYLACFARVADRGVSASRLAASG
jgi:glycosyltransferase involved in cell wall biosynthesis